eukprot:TRINITY_DN15651_c0_g1_i1.p1 TRINITY_DN15651_c0_g1~~TRINITY_DN15651_c0_g1_i1.p1  ORF type:complete len:194 (+),score=40.98 TRINITY_DN15651_c0_g1_i1:14-595(+)
MNRIAILAEHIIDSIDKNEDSIKIFLSGFSSSIANSFIFNQLCSGLTFGKNCELEIVLNNNSDINKIVCEDKECAECFSQILMDSNFPLLKNLQIEETNTQIIEADISILFENKNKSELAKFIENYHPCSPITLFINTSEENSSFLLKDGKIFFFQLKLNENKPIFSSQRISKLLNKILNQSQDSVEGEISYN